MLRFARSTRWRALSTRVVPTVPLFIDGQLVQSAATEFSDVHDPATGKLLCRTPHATDAELQAAISSSAGAARTWAATPVTARCRVMSSFAQLIRERTPELAAVITAEQGKTLADSRGDVFRGLEVVETATHVAHSTLGSFAEGVATDIDTFSVRQPLGVCAGIAPFNFPAMARASLLPPRGAAPRAPLPCRVSGCARL